MLLLVVGNILFVIYFQTSWLNFMFECPKSGKYPFDGWVKWKKLYSVTIKVIVKTWLHYQKTLLTENQPLAKNIFILYIIWLNRRFWKQDRCAFLYISCNLIFIYLSYWLFWTSLVILGVSLRTGHQASWQAVRTILPTWFKYLAQRFSYKEVHFK